ncbi:MAG: hypothetical protein LBB63_01270 [Holosporaceae bacterium]|jgi:hypothetical protein|nr:hypothetical protein [Holosporaceae bacterium]
MKKIATVGFAACLAFGIVGEVRGIQQECPSQKAGASGGSSTKHDSRGNQTDQRPGDGFYVILGCGVGAVANKMDANTRLSDHGEWRVGAVDHLNGAFVAAELPALPAAGYVVNRADVNAANNLVTYIDATYRSGFFRARGSTGFGSLGGGFGRYVGGRAYLGCEVSCDFGSSHRVTKCVRFPGTNGGASYSAASGGGSMNLDCRVGYLESAGTLLYLKLGVRRVHCVVSCGGVSFAARTCRFAPSLGIGVEQSVGRGASIRLEGEHQFSTKHNAQLHFVPGYPVNFDGSMHAHLTGLRCFAASTDVSQRNNRWCSRFLLQYNIGQL